MPPIEPSTAQLDHYYIHEPCLNDFPSSYSAKRVHSPQALRKYPPKLLDTWIAGTSLFIKLQISNISTQGDWTL